MQGLPVLLSLSDKKHLIVMYLVRTLHFFLHHHPHRDHHSHHHDNIKCYDSMRFQPSNMDPSNPHVIWTPTPRQIDKNDQDACAVLSSMELQQELPM